MEEGFGAVQVFGIPLIEREVVEVRLVRRRCRCGAVTRADAPPGISGPACYGPNLRAFTPLPAAEGQISTDRTAKLIAGLPEISTGFVDRCLSRLDAPLDRFEAQSKAGPPRAHLLRDPQGVPDDAPDEEHAAWARAVQRILREAGQAAGQAHAAGHTTPHESERARINREFATAARCGISINPHNNNASEQALRDIKVKMKVNGCHGGRARAARQWRRSSSATASSR